jgi:nitroreductase
MTGPLSVAEAIKVRRSVRNFAGPLPPERQSIVTQAIAEAQQLPVPFGTTVEVADHPAGIGRFVISNEAGWLIGKVPTGAPDLAPQMIDVAYRLQHVVIRLTQHGIATVWVAGTFKRSVVEQENPGFVIPVAIAYGDPPPAGPGLLSRFMSWAGGATTRYPFDQLFFDAKRNAPITEETAGKFLALLEAVRLGPSAMNKQPWRIVVVDNDTEPSIFELFLAVENEMHLLDIGIALGQIALTLAVDGKTVQFNVPEEKPAPSPLGGRFIISALIPQ